MGGMMRPPFVRQLERSSSVEAHPISGDNLLVSWAVREKICGHAAPFYLELFSSHLMWQHHFKAILISTFLLGVGIGLLSFGLMHVQTDQRLAKSSEVIEGRVISSTSRPLSKGGQSLTLVVEYVPKNHVAITKEFDVDSGDYKSAQATGKAKVTYLPEDPQVSRVTHFAALPFQILIGLGGLMTLAGLFCFVHALKTLARA